MTGKKTEHTGADIIEFFSDFIGKSVVVGYREGIEDVKYIKGQYTENKGDFLVLSSYGRKKFVHNSLVVEIRETEGVVP